MKEQQFYVYLYLRTDDTPYYVGKGSGNRWSENYGRPCQRPKDKCRILIKECLSESEAYEMEMHLISLYGRKDLGTGILHNRCEGGNGWKAGVRWTEARRAAYKANPKKNWVTRSREFSDEHRKHLSEAQKGKLRPWRRKYASRAEGLRAWRARQKESVLGRAAWV